MEFLGLLKRLGDQIVRSLVTPVLEYLQITADHGLEDVRYYVSLAISQEFNFVETWIELANLRQSLGEFGLLEKSAHYVGDLVRE